MKKGGAAECDRPVFASVPKVVNQVTNFYHGA